MTLNRLTLIGFVGADAEEKTNSKPLPYTVFSVATSSSWKNEAGEWQSQPTWHRCVANGKLAGFALTLKKGAHVHIEGELQSREFDKNGVAQKTFECRVRSILKLDRVIQQKESTEDEDSVV
jgi:single-strand DNA-binding protein